MTGPLHWITHCYHLQVELQTKTHHFKVNSGIKRPLNILTAIAKPVCQLDHNIHSLMKNRNDKRLLAVQGQTKT